MNKGHLFGALTFVLLIGSFPVFSDEVRDIPREALEEMAVPSDQLQANLLEYQGVFYAVEAVDKNENYRSMCENQNLAYKTGPEVVKESYQGNEGVCGAMLAQDALASLQTMLTRYQCSDPSDGSIGFSIAHTSFTPDTSRAPLVLAQSTQVTCEESPGASSKGVFSTKRNGWQRQCADRDCYAAFWSPKSNRVYLLVPTPVTVRPEFFKKLETP